MNQIHLVYYLCLSIFILLTLSSSSSSSSSMSIPNKNCSLNKEIKCNNSNKCIKSNQICDGINDCPDKSDEQNCQWCNRTFNNDATNNRFLLSIPIKSNYSNLSQLFCYYKINNLKPNNMIVVRARKFSIGTFNTRLRLCEKSWIEIKESDVQTNDYDDYESEMHDQNSYMRIVSFSDEKRKHYDLKRLKRLDKLFINEQNATRNKKTLKSGKICGSLHNFLSSYYSNRRYLIIKYFVSNLTQTNDVLEFEITFHSSLSLNPHFFSKQKQKFNNLKRLNYGNMTENEDDAKCDKVFTGCSNDQYEACLISSPNYPGIYLKNLRCLYFIKNSESLLNQKLILINDNFHIDGQMCQYADTKRPNSQQSYFCDSGPRSSTGCNDYLNIYDGMNTFSTQQYSLAILKNLCGIGHLPKIITKKNALVLDFFTGSDGNFVNNGFLFYVMNQKEYSKNFHKFNKFEKNELKNSYELSSVALLDKYQIENCNSDMTNCIIQLNDDSISQLYDNEPIQTKFKVGYLYGMNQYHPNMFTLTYVLRTKKFNTIALFVEKYQPKQSTQTNNKCNSVYLSIETSNQLLTQFQDYYDDYDDLASTIDMKTTSLQTQPTHLNLTTQFKHHSNENNPKTSLFKVCDPKEITSRTIRLFLIKSTNNFDDKLTKSKSKTSILVNYFTSQGLVAKTTGLFDFKLTYEFFDFDWRFYQENTVCNFVYDFNVDNNLEYGFIKNPQASIFYKTTDERLKCKYRLIAKENQYIKLTFMNMNFNLNKCENVYFDLNSSNNQTIHLLNTKCKNLDKKITIRELKYTILKTNETELNESDDQLDYDDILDDDDPFLKNKVFERKMCLCSISKPNQVYISKYDTIEIEYDVKLNKTDLNNYDFQIKYEFIDRLCSNLVVPNLKSKNKGRILYLPKVYGLQTEIIEMKNSANLNQFQQAVVKNLNFNCKFHIKAPKNKFIYIEFIDFLLRNKQCNQNYIKLYSFYSRRNMTSHANILDMPQLPFISLCTSSESKQPNKSLDKSSNNTLRKNTVTAHFFKETNINQALLCYNTKSKVCFLSNELESDLNPFTNLNSTNRGFKKDFYNEIIIDIMANELKNFYFDLKYHFFEIDLEKLSLSSLNMNKDTISTFSLKRIMNNDKCAFRCPIAKMKNNLTLQICLDESLICDGDIDCIFNDEDESTCPLRLNVKVILLVLCSVFSFTLIVLFLTFLYRNYLNQVNKLNELHTPKQKYKNVRYSQASTPIENYVIEN